MINKKDITWYLEDPTRFLKKKPFTRGGEFQSDDKGNVNIATKSQVSFSDLNLYEVTQDTYIQEYDPSLHKIKFNKSIPHIAVKIGGRTIDIDDMTETAAYQKVIHAAHVLHLTAHPMDFTLCNLKDPKKKKSWAARLIDIARGTTTADENDDMTLRFQEVKQEWLLRNMESVKYDFVSKQKKLGDVGLLYIYDKSRNKFFTKIYSYDEGYIIIPNYNEYGEQIACSLYYKTDDGTAIIDVYDDKNHYRLYPSKDGDTENGWTVEDGQPHGFSRCPLLYKRGKVAWEYSESTIEMWELMANINAVALKRFGTFGMVLIGQMSKESFTRDSSTLVINLSSDTSNGKQDAKTIEFPEPQKMIDYLDSLETKISIFSSVSFITPKDLKSTGSGGNGIFLAMKNDLALATQSISDWEPVTNDMVRLFQEGLSLESGNINRYNDLKISAKFKAWSMESDTTKVTNLAMQSKWLSRQSIIEKSPDAAPDELERVYNEMLLAKEKENAEALKAEKIARNNSSAIQDENIRQINSNNATK